MIKTEKEAREKIMAAAMELIEQHGDTDKITIRDIATKAGVGVGLINYHFQTKENLIDQCVQRMISKVIDRFEPFYRSLDMEPLDKLRFLVKSTSSFLSANPGISRISIVNDMISGSTHDNSVQTTKAYFMVLKEIFGDKKTDRELSVLLHMLISSIQAAFLRSHVLKETLGLDFTETPQRDAFVDMVIDCIFKNQDITE